ncbi:MAG: leucyl/phenylalanyl-tRNA--protein transferase [Burkholderiales bacterium]|jgi:leucyl/phenylalanyl-tRNA--protein transferase|nr:leucyl/phenylalanyl-tRNA--protein transferase [Burkholderiales bacterium]
MIPWLGRRTPFPPVDTALDDPPGLLAAGGDLSPARLLDAYAHGIFPWFNDGEPILWWSPDPRMVLDPTRLRVTRSLDKVLRNRPYEIHADRAFRDVMLACAAPRDGADGTWISAPMVDAYCALHAQGVAHSVEVWIDGALAGGLYGVSLGHMFFGESMFSRARDASKIALVHLARHLAAQGDALIDCQMHTPHLASLGATRMPRARFVERVSELIHSNATPMHWNMGRTTARDT